MIEIPLTRGHVALVDDTDAPMVLAAGKWSASEKNGRVYALRHWRRADGGDTTIRLHNFITGWRYVDHRNGDGLDNRRANLRPATQAQNNLNRGATRRNTSGYKGVTWHKAAGKWAAQIKLRGRNMHLGLFADPAEAAAAYDAAAIDMHGEFARPNFPQEQSA